MIPNDPPEIKHGMPTWLKAGFDALRKYINEAQPIQGNGINIDESPNGRSISVSLAWIQENTSPPLVDIAFDFQLIDVTTVAGEYKARMRYGTCNGIVGDASMNPGDSPSYIITLSGTSNRFILKSYYDADLLTTTNSILQLATKPDDDNTAVYLDIGSFSITAGVLSLANNIRTSITYILIPQLDTDIPFMFSNT